MLQPLTTGIRSAIGIRRIIPFKRMNQSVGYETVRIGLIGVGIGPFAAHSVRLTKGYEMLFALSFFT